MKKNIFIFSFIIIAFSVKANDKNKIALLFQLKYNYNLPIKGNPLCLTDYKYTGISSLYPLTFNRAPSIQIQMGIKLKRTVHLLGFSSIYSIFTSNLDAELNDGLLLYLNGPVPTNSEKFELKLYTKTKYSCLLYTIQYEIPVFKHEGLFIGLNLFYGRNKNAYYTKTYMQSYNQGASDNQFYYSEYNEKLTFNKNACGMEFLIGYNQNIWNGIQLSAYSGISYRFISIYYHFGLGLNYKFSLPKKKKE